MNAFGVLARQAGMQMGQDLIDHEQATAPEQKPDCRRKPGRISQAGTDLHGRNDQREKTRGDHDPGGRAQQAIQHGAVELLDKEYGKRSQGGGKGGEQGGNQCLHHRACCCQLVHGMDFLRSGITVVDRETTARRPRRDSFVLSPGFRYNLRHYNGEARRSQKHVFLDTGRPGGRWPWSMAVAIGSTSFAISRRGCLALCFDCFRRDALSGGRQALCHRSRQIDHWVAFRLLGCVSKRLEAVSDATMKNG